jgi:hypothetical protein
MMNADETHEIAAMNPGYTPSGCHFQKLEYQVKFTWFCPEWRDSPDSFHKCGDGIDNFTDYFVVSVPDHPDPGIFQDLGNVVVNVRPSCENLSHACVSTYVDWTFDMAGGPMDYHPAVLWNAACHAEVIAFSSIDCLAINDAFWRGWFEWEIAEPYSDCYFYGCALLDYFYHARIDMTSVYEAPREPQLPYTAGLQFYLALYCCDVSFSLTYHLFCTYSAGPYIG